MSDANLQSLFDQDHPTVNYHSDFKIVGPITIPTKIGKNKNNLKAYLFSGKNEKYVACMLGDISDSDNTLVRVSSACIFGFILNSLLCDCRDQYEQALSKMHEHGCGIMIYCIDQHGKGIGLDAHFLVYAEGQRQNKGLFYEIYNDLGIEDDYRNYDETIEIINYLKNENNIKKITLLTEAPNKIKYFRDKCTELGIDIDFASFEIEETPENSSELSEKKTLGYKIFTPSNSENDMQEVVGELVLDHC